MLQMLKEEIVHEYREGSLKGMAGIAAGADSPLLREILQKTDLKTAITLIKQGSWFVEWSVSWFGITVSP